MDINIECQIQLSPQLAEILGESGCITLTGHNLSNSMGNGHLYITSNRENGAILLSPDELYIAIIPTKISENVSNQNRIAEKIPNREESVSNIFSSIPKNREKIANKIATTDPEIVKNTKIPHKTEEATPEQQEKAQTYQKVEEEIYIATLEELMQIANQVSKVKHAKKRDLDSMNPRTRALAIEQMEIEESMGIPAWIVNDKTANIIISDIEISLKQNSPFDLSRISAKRIIKSNDLRSVIEKGYVKFITPEERDVYIAKVIEDQNAEDERGFKAFGNKREAERSFAEEDTKSTSKSKEIMDTSNSGGLAIGGRKELLAKMASMGDGMEVSEKEIDQPTDEEKMMMELSSQAPTTNTRKFSNITNQDPIVKKPSNMKSIRRLEQ